MSPNIVDTTFKSALFYFLNIYILGNISSDFMN